MTLSDVLDALRSERVYKRAWSEKKVFEYIESEKGRHFDPILVDILFENIDMFSNIEKIKLRYEEERRLENFKHKNREEFIF